MNPANLRIFDIIFLTIFSDTGPHLLGQAQHGQVSNLIDPERSAAALIESA